MPFPEFPTAFVFLRNQLRRNRSQYNRTRMPLKIGRRWQRECSPRTCHWKCTENSETGLSYQCCGSGIAMDLRSGFFHPRCRKKDTESQIRIRNKEFMYFYAKNVTELSEIWSGMFIPDPGSGFFPSRSPDPPNLFSTAGRIITSSRVSVPGSGSGLALVTLGAW